MLAVRVRGPSGAADAATDRARQRRLYLQTSRRRVPAVLSAVRRSARPVHHHQAAVPHLRRLQLFWKWRPPARCSSGRHTAALRLGAACQRGHSRKEHSRSTDQLWAGYWAPSLQRTSYLRNGLYRGASYLFHHYSVVVHFLCAYSTLGHHPHPLAYPCAKFRFHSAPHHWANPRRKLSQHTQSLTHSISQLIWCAGNRSFPLGTHEHMHIV